MNPELLRLILFITSSIALGRKYSGAGVDETKLSENNLGGPWILSHFEKLRPPSISQERRSSSEKYIPETKNGNIEKAKIKKRDSIVRGHFLKDYEDKTPTVSPQEKVPELEVQKPSKQIEAPQKGVLKNIDVDISFKMDEEVKGPIKEQALEKSKNSGTELPQPLLLITPDKIKASFYSLPKEKKILLGGGGAIITLFIIDKLLEKNSGYKARKEKVLTKVGNLFKQFINNLPRI